MPKSTPRQLARARWHNMIRRCTDPTDVHYPWWGGRGITIDPRWLESFEDFYADVGDAPEGKSFDRYPDNDGPYAPGNWRWATPKEQIENRRYNPMSIKTHCPQGHPYDDENTYVTSVGWRICRTCNRASCRRYQASIQKGA